MRNALTFSVLILALGMALPATAQTLSRATFVQEGEVTAKSAQLCPGDITLDVGQSVTYLLTVTADPGNTVPLTGNYFEIASTSEVRLSNYTTSQGTWTVQESHMGRLEAGTLNPGASYNLEVRWTGAVPGNGVLTLTRGSDQIEPVTEECSVTIEALPPDITATKADQLDDSNGDGAANPGERLTYTITITNFGDGEAEDVVFTDAAGDHPNTTLVAGSVTTTQGQIASGNGAGATDVRVDVGTLDGDGDQVTITFDVRIADPFPPNVDEVVNQGRVNGDNFDEVLTDDVEVSGSANPTVTSVPSQLVIERITPTASPTLDAGESVVYTITVVYQGSSAPVAGAVVEVNDALQGGVFTTSQTDANGQTTYEAVVPEGTSDGQYTLTFVARAEGFDNSDPVNRQIDVVNRVPGLAVEPVIVDFGPVRLDDTANSPITIGNTGNGQLDVNGVQITGDHAADFALPALDLPLSVAPGGSANFSVRFMPGRRGQRNADLEINSNGGNVTVSLAGEGAAPDISAAPDTIHYGLVGLGAPTEGTAIITNTGNADLTLERMEFRGDDASAFSFISGGGQQVLPPGTTHEVVVRFAPEHAGAHLARLVFFNNATDDEGNLVGNVRIRLVGDGAVARISAAPDTMHYGLVGLGAPTERTAIITNTGNADLILERILVVGGDASAFSIIRGGGQQVLPPGTTHEVVVRFVPQRAGAHLSRLVIIHNATDDAGNPVGNVQLWLVGDGAVARISVAPDTIHYGLVSLGAPTEGTAIITNTGNADLTLERMEFRGDDASAFSFISGGGQQVLPPGTTHEVVVRFAPEHAGAHLARLVFFNNATDDEGNLVGNVRIRLVGDGAMSLDPPAASPANNGSSIEISVPVQEGFTPTSRQLFFRRSGETAYQPPVNLQEAADGGLEGAIPAEFVTERGVEYYVRLSGGAVTETFPAEDPEDNPVRLRVQVSELQAGGMFLAEIYRMVSAPLELQDRSIQHLLDDLGPLDPTRWRALRWQAADSIYVEVGEGATLNVDGFQAGRAFWLITRRGEGFNVVNGRSTDASESFTINLPPGWSQIGNPFAFPVAVGSIVSTGIYQGPYFYDGAIEDYRMLSRQDGVLEPWQGYFVNNPDSEEVVTLSIAPMEAGGTLAREVTLEDLFPEADFMLQLRAELPALQLRDMQNYIGFAEQAAGQPHAFNLAEPPPIGDHLRLSILEGSKRYLSYFKPVGEEGRQWDLEVTAIMEQGRPFDSRIVQVALVEHGQRPEGFDLYVFDRDLGRILPVEGGVFHVELMRQHPVRHLSIVLGTSTFAEAKSEGASLVPVAYVLEQNYPNPFNPETVIRYGLDRQSLVVLEIYNMLGQRVRTLVEAEQKSGRYEVVWDGQDEAGHPAASGLYVYQLRAGAFIASRKMLLLR